MKKIVSLVLVVALLVVSVGAQAPSVVDKEGLLSLTEAETLESSFNQYHEAFGFTVAAATAESFEGLTADAFARRCYEVNGYDHDGILLLISEGEGQWYLYTTGICAQVISESDAAQIGQSLVADMEAGNYYNAFKVFAEKCTEPVCQRLNEDAIREDATFNEHQSFLVIGLAGGMGMGILLAVMLWLVIRRAKKKQAEKPNIEFDPI